ncbi:hypothetical protein HO173_011931 [Letharia columbiana]|uniref:Uncharacterized protein n=1 Tax=Letharia columbiana TaxID=112416 RepID=A0A8H6CQW5_9LECA|nr:uncharacterized protein HO173_011931 [Letharia columbiana]KAF6227829.1 hypothetical protein HO173_011931 [Letharia columbiana]
MTDLHEPFHLVSLTYIYNVPHVYPPNADWNSTGWNQWEFNEELQYISHGYMAAAYVGLAAPSHARDNAHNFAVFAFCIYHIELQCLGTFQSDVKTRRDLPFESAFSPKAVEGIRQGTSDLRRD